VNFLQEDGKDLGFHYEGGETLYAKRWNVWST